ncbi:MAG: hypothetical protein E6713_01670 [Sporomusaceae bacterium]|nr:hypothetical protein [Sporomusaceae bacterium]
MKKDLHSQGGFLLAEALIAIMFCVALLALGGFYIMLSKSTTNSANYTNATNLAQLYIETFKAAQKSTDSAVQQFKVTATQTPAFDGAALIDPKTLPKIYENYTVTFTPEPVTTSDTAKNSAKTLIAYTVKVTWQEQNKPLQVKLITFIPQR